MTAPRPHHRTNGTTMGHPIEHDAAGSRLVARVGARPSLLLYRLRDGVMTIVHTEVPDEVSGQGIAADLMRAALDLARSHGWRVRPACSYAAAFMDKHPEYADLLA
jgi:predicted GNAT family acetyltransferase